MKNLTEKEQTLYDLIVLEGMNLNEVANAMRIDLKTAKQYQHNVFIKTQCASQRELVRNYYKELQNEVPTEAEMYAYY